MSVQKMPLMKNANPQLLSSTPNGARRFWRFLMLATVIVCAGLAGCVVMNGKDTTTSGRKIDDATFAQVVPGKTKDFVEALLGEPSEKKTKEDGTVQWRWRYSERHDSNTGFIVLFASHSSSTMTQNRYVEFKDGVVTREWTE